MLVSTCVDILLTAIMLATAALSQPALLTGRFEPALGNTDPTILPVIISWPFTQVTVNFSNSTTVTAVLVDSTYSGMFSFADLNQYVAFTATGGASSGMAINGNTARLEIAGLSLAQQTATITKIDESSEGKLLLAWLEKQSLHPGGVPHPAVWTPANDFRHLGHCRKPDCRRVRA